MSKMEGLETVGPAKKVGAVSFSGLTCNGQPFTQKVLELRLAFDSDKTAAMGPDSLAIDYQATEGGRFLQSFVTAVEAKLEPTVSAIKEKTSSITLKVSNHTRWWDDQNAVFIRPEVVPRGSTINVVLRPSFWKKGDESGVRFGCIDVQLTSLNEAQEALARCPFEAGS